MPEKIKPPNEEIERIRRSFQRFYDAVSERDGEIFVNVVGTHAEVDEVVGFGFVTNPMGAARTAMGRPTEFPGTLSNVLRYSED